MKIWIDVGAYPCGYGIENIFEIAKNDPTIMVYAFEPNLLNIASYFAQLPNYIVIPMAVAENNGFGTFYFSNLNGSDSLLQYDSNYKDFKNIKTAVVPTIRLDTFMEQMRLDSIDFLKIDAQGYDFYVVRSLGKYIKKVKVIHLEVQMTDPQLYVGAKTKSEVLNFLENNGFELINVEYRKDEENITFKRTIS